MESTSHRSAPSRSTAGGEWRGADFALGTHGPSRTGKLVRLNGPHVTDVDVFTSGSTVAFSIPSRAPGNPSWFTFVVAAAREGGDEEVGGGYAPRADARHPPLPVPRLIA